MFSNSMFKSSVFRQISTSSYVSRIQSWAIVAANVVGSTALATAMTRSQYDDWILNEGRLLAQGFAAAYLTRPHLTFEDCETEAHRTAKQFLYKKLPMETAQTHLRHWLQLHQRNPRHVANTILNTYVCMQNQFDSLSTSKQSSVLDTSVVENTAHPMYPIRDIMPGLHLGIARMQNRTHVRQLIAALRKAKLAEIKANAGRCRSPPWEYRFDGLQNQTDKDLCQAYNDYSSWYNSALGSMKEGTQCQRLSNLPYLLPDMALLHPLLSTCVMDDYQYLSRWFFSIDPILSVFNPPESKLAKQHVHEAEFLHPGTPNPFAATFERFERSVGQTD